MADLSTKKSVPGNSKSRKAVDNRPRTDSSPVGSGNTTATPVTEAYLAKGDWNPLWDQLRRLDPEFMEAYLAFRDVPHRKGPLPPHIKELILVAINVATTHLYGPGARRHMQNALRHGATPAELLETIELTTVMGIHACNLAIPIMAEEVEKFNSEPRRCKVTES